jgi:hypothetical protein
MGKGDPKLSKNEDSRIEAGMFAIVIAICLLAAFLAWFNFDEGNSQRISPPTTMQPATHDWYGQTLEVAGKACFFEFVLVNEKGAKELRCTSLEKGSLVQVVGDYVPFIRGLSIPINLWPANLVNGGQAGYISDDDLLTPAVGKTYLISTNSLVIDASSGSYAQRNGEHLSVVLEQNASQSGLQFCCHVKVIGLPVEGRVPCNSMTAVMNGKIVVDDPTS